MKHILLIDPLEKLVIKKDSSLLFAHSLKECGHEVYVIFEKNLAFDNTQGARLEVTSFDSKLKENSFYLDFFTLNEELETLILDKETVVHMRLDPPFDTRYLQCLWLLNTLKKSGAQIINDPNGILLNNEKILAYERSLTIDTFIGQDWITFQSFITKLNVSELIFKPIDLYQGIGVEKIKVDELLKENFLRKVKELKGSVVVQPFIAEVAKGEIRSSFFKAKHMGSILKVPKSGEFLANIAQGASFHAIELEEKLMQECHGICKELMDQGIYWVAFDILGGKISEVNITCPGLVVEVSEASKKNIALEMAKML